MSRTLFLGLMSIVCLCVSNIALVSRAMGDPPPTGLGWSEYDEQEWFDTWGMSYIPGISAIAVHDGEEGLQWELEVCSNINSENEAVWEVVGTLGLAIEVPLPPEVAIDIVSLTDLEDVYDVVLGLDGVIRVETRTFAGTLMNSATGYSEHVFGLLGYLHCDFQDPGVCDFELTLVVPLQVYESIDDAINEAVEVAGADIEPPAEAVMVDPETEWKHNPGDVNQDLIDRIRALQALSACREQYIDDLHDCGDTVGLSLVGCTAARNTAINTAYGQYQADLASINWWFTIGAGVGGAYTGGKIGALAGAWCGGIGEVIGAPLGAVLGGATGAYYTNGHQRAIFLRNYNNAVRAAKSGYHNCVGIATIAYNQCAANALEDFEECKAAIPGLDDVVEP